MCKRFLALVLSLVFSVSLLCSPAFAISANEKLYVEQLDTVCNAIDGDDYELGENNLSSLYSAEGYGASKANIGYAFVDLNGDGVSELLIGNDYTIMNMFAIVNGVVKRIFTGAERDRYGLCKGNIIYNFGSGGAADSVYCLYKFNGKSLSLVERVESISHYDDDYESIDYVHQVGKGIEIMIDEDEYSAIFKRFDEDYPEKSVNYTALRYYGAPKVIPRSTALSSVSNTKGKKLSVKWKKNSTATAYQIQYSTVKGFKSDNKTVTVTGNAATSKTISNLKKNKTYYVRIRSAKTVDGKTRYSPWSSSKKVKISK